MDWSAAREAQPLPPSRYIFPDVRAAPAEGLVAKGGDFAPETIVAAYRAGIFPWPHGAEDHLWFSPDPRAILPFDGLRVPRRLERTIRSGRFRLTVDQAFAQVIAGCAQREEGTWITPAIVAAYVRLHELGWAHSVEAWDGEGTLAGGLYGLRVGGLFGAESMFHRQSDASKVAMAGLMRWARGAGIRLIDVQMLTPHLERMGCVAVPRAEYLRMVEAAVGPEVAG